MPPQKYLDTHFTKQNSKESSSFKIKVKICAEINSPKRHVDKKYESEETSAPSPCHN